jgi:HemY protein
MIRVVIFLVLVGLLALGAAWLADRPGDVVITWQGQRIETTVMRLTMGLLAAVAALIFLWTVLSALVRSPFIVPMRRSRAA